jgi:predicted component of type VI protein secretion system
VSKKLVINDGTRERELQLVGRLVVGRDPTCDISDDHSLLSRRHAEFVTVGDGVTIRDLGSRNGVFVNGSRAAERALEPGDVVQIGPLRARYVVDDAPLSITPETLDSDRTAMLRKPATGVIAAATAAVPVASVPSVLEDTVVPHADVDEDVTRMVPAPARAITGPSASDEEVTRFTPGPVVPDLNAAFDATAPTGPVVMPAMPSPPAAMPRVDAGLNGFVLSQSMLLAGAAVIGALAAVTIAPGLPGTLLAFAIAAVAAFLVAGIINRRVSAALEGSGRDRN